jgi:hypothetical protein
MARERLTRSGQPRTSVPFTRLCALAAATSAATFAALGVSGAIEVTVVRTDNVQVQVELPLSGTEPWLHFTTRVAKATGYRHFGLANATDGAPITRHTWERVRSVLAQENRDHDRVHDVSARRGGRRMQLLVSVANATSPAASVDPFWACEKTNVPQPAGIAANWCVCVCVCARERVCVQCRELIVFCTSCMTRTRRRLKGNAIIDHGAAAGFAPSTLSTCRHTHLRHHFGNHC